MKPHIIFLRGSWRCGFKDEDKSLWWTWGETPTIALQRKLASFGCEFS
jgi:hypothetical protein